MRDLNADARLDTLTDYDAVARVTVAIALRDNPKATIRTQRVARRLVAVYEQNRTDGMGHADAFRDAWRTVHDLAEMEATR